MRLDGESKTIYGAPRGGRGTLSRVGATACVALALALVAGCGSDDDGDTTGEAKRPDAVPAGSVAVVGDSPITKRQLERRVATLRRTAGKHSTPAQRKQLESQALSGLLHQEAIEQEAADRDLTVSRREVRRRWSSAKQAQFASEKALKRFLGGQTERDVLRQLRLQLLTEKVHDQIREQDGDEAVERFQRDLQERWSDRTACRPRYAAAGCGDRSE